MLTKEQILKADDKVHKEIDCPRWGGPVRLQALDGDGRDQWEEMCADATDSKKYRGIRSTLIALCLVGEDGERVFETDEDIEALNTRDAGTLNMLFEACQALSKISDKDVEDLAGN